MVVAAFFFTAQTAAAKVARVELDAIDIIAWRGIVAIPLALLLAGRSKLDVGHKGTFVLRALLGFFGIYCFFTAAGGLSVGDVALIGKMQPLLVGLLAPLIFGQSERVGPLAWLALIVGLCGAALLIGPQLSIGSTFGLWAFAGSILSAGSHLTIRSLGRTEEPVAMVLWFQVSLIVLSTGSLLLFSGRLPQTPSTEVWPAVAITAVTATLGQYFMAKAYQHDRAAIVAGASYAGPIWGLAIDLVIFDTAPPLRALAGGALIIAAGLAFLRRG
jgi:drug/metabolite transporter (DMT)-like permease